LYVQFAAVVLLTPAYLGGTIAAEKDGRRLELLFVAGLSSRDIVLGKLFAGLARLGLILLAGLPILALLEFLGGIDPNLLLVGYTATAMTMLSLGALSILCSVHARKPRDAIVLTYLVALAFMAITYLAHALVPPPNQWSSGEVDEFLAMRRSEFPQPVEVFSRGNPIVTLMHLREVWTGKTTLAEQLPGTLLPYVLVHGLAALLCTGWAVLRLRASALTSSRPASAKPWLFWRRWRGWRPAPRILPLLWKEIFVDHDRAFWRVGRALCLLLLLLSFIPVLRMAWLSVTKQELAYGPVDREFALLFADVWCRGAITVLASLSLVGVAIHAAGALSGELEHRTLDSLLTTPLGLSAILFSKWLGSLLSARRSWYWLLGLWALSMACGGTHWRILLFFLGAWALYAGSFAMLGLYFSLRCANTQRATLWTLAAVVVLGLGHWLSWFFVKHSWGWPTFPATIQVYGLTPPASLGWIALRGEAAFLPDGEAYRGDISIIRWGAALDMTRSDLLLRRSEHVVGRKHLNATLGGMGVGALMWLGLGALLWFGTLRRLRLLRGGGMSGVNRSVAREPVKESAACADSDPPATIPIAPAA
jgi:ABC-type transport system involved in multi-copper enzyme maturation permease subunit